MSAEVNSIPWFALHIRIYKNDSVEISLRNKGFDVFAPSYTAKRVVAGRERQISAPLFPGYMFCALDAAERLPVLTIPGVIKILGTRTALTVIPAEEIEAIRRTIASGLPLEPFDLLQPGEPVEVQRGPLAGIRGEVVYHKGRHRLVIRISALNDRAVSVEVDQANVARSTPAIFPGARGFVAPFMATPSVNA
jgi:transcription termination/antitermination protein NusG